MFRRGQSGFRLRLRLRRGDGGGEPRCEIGTVASLQRQGTPNSQVNGDGITADGGYPGGIGVGWQARRDGGRRRRTANPDVKSGLSLRSSDKERPILK